MNADDYQTAAARTLIAAPQQPFTAEELQIILDAIDLVVKAGKVAEYVKKSICHRHGFAMAELSKRLVDVSRATSDLMNADITPAPDLIFSGAEQMMLWCALGLGGEAGEVLENVSAIDQVDLFDRGDTAKELGDLMWYVAATCELADIPLGLVLARNIAKLEKRYPNGYSSADSKARVDID
jgi:NTP pyrophosphatase (non-canonical NTP hydrolase)